jgi:Tfp pilus assembly protein PilF
MKAFASITVLVIIIVGGFACAVMKPKTPEQNYDYAKHYQALGDFVQADRFLTKAIEKKPDYLEAYILRADVNKQRDSLVRAIKDYTTILEMSNLSVQKKAEILNLRGSTYRLNLQDTLACRDWNVACEQFGYTSACNNKRSYCKKK